LTKKKDNYTTYSSLKDKILAIKLLDKEKR